MVERPQFSISSITANVAVITIVNYPHIAAELVKIITTALLVVTMITDHLIRYASPGEKPHYAPSFERTNWQTEQASILSIKIFNEYQLTEQANI